MINETPTAKSATSPSTSATTNQPKIAYFILAHRFPKQFKRLFKAIYDPENYYLIHVDLKAEKHVAQEIGAFLKKYQNAFVMKSENVVWGGYSMVRSALNGMKYLLSKDIKWDFFINLSGQDFPLKSQSFIRDFLEKNGNKNFIKVANQAIERSDTMNRLENYFHETSNGFSGKPYKRALMHDVTFYIGGQWMILTRTCCEFICSSLEVKKFEDFYRNTLIADESFFQTVLMNTTFNEVIVNDDKRAIIWVPDGEIKLRPKTLLETDLGFLLGGKNLFARKFDEEEDALVLDILESTLSSTMGLYQSKIRGSVNTSLVSQGINHNLANEEVNQKKILIN